MKKKRDLKSPILGVLNKKRPTAEDIAEAKKRNDIRAKKRS